jgi:hypothetical protein
MEKGKKVQLNLYLPIQYRDILRKMAAERSLDDPNRVYTAAGLGKEIICKYLEQKVYHQKEKEA